MTLRRLLAFWAPLEATWLMMALEGPFLAALIARLEAPKLNLAAYGVALSLAMLVEAPVIMLMSAGTALAADAASYRKLRSFTVVLDGLVTVLMVVALIPTVFHQLSRAMDLPAEIAAHTWTALLLFLPWPAAIGYRRLYQGILIRSGSTRQVAAGTVIRLSTMAGVGAALAWSSSLDGAAVGAASLSAGVVLEAIASRWMARRAVARLLRTQVIEVLGYGDILRFYYPLALTSLLNMGIQPIVTFFLVRGRFPIESLAVLPVVNSLVFLFRTLGLAGQETTIAVLSRRPSDYRIAGRFMRWLAAFASGTLALIALTPVAPLWFQRISGLAPPLAAFATSPSAILSVMPALTAWMCWQRGVLVVGKSTRAVTFSTILEVGGVVLAMMVGNAAGATGIVAAAWALVIGRVAGNVSLVPAVASTAARMLGAGGAPVRSAGSTPA